MATNVTGLRPSRLFYVTGNSSRLRFLVDTGAQISVIPATATDQKAARSSLASEQFLDPHLLLISVSAVPSVGFS